MALSPLDIKNKTFPIKMRGYNSEEVDEFIDQVITDYEDVLTERRELEKALKHAEEKLTYFNELKDALNQSIIVAQDTADKVKESAIRESDLLLSTANSEAKDIVAKANITREQIIKEANRQARETMSMASENASSISTKSDELKKQTREYHRSLSLMLESQLQIVKSQDWKDLLSTNFKSEETDHESDSHAKTEERELPKSVELADLIGKVYEPKVSEADSEDEFYDDYYEYYEDDEEVTVVEPVIEAVVTPTPEVDEEVATEWADDTEHSASERKRRKRN